ncbi:MAG: hypothetical protein AB7O66_02815 [Limisphaerales bacterium]
MYPHPITKLIAPCSLALGALVCSHVQAQTALFEWGINRDGVITGLGDALPPGSVFDTSTGLGTVRMVFSTPGAHQGILFVDHELSEALNTFFNELGAVTGSPSAGQTWEIDEPGFSADPGDIFDNFLAGTLDNGIGKSDEDDVSMAIGYDFVLTPGQTGTINFLLSPNQPNGGFYLTHSDPDSGESIYFSSSLRIDGGNVVVPEGQTVLAGGLITLLAALGVWRNRRNQPKANA